MLMLPIGLWRLHIIITINILDIIHSPVFYLKHNISKTGFCSRLHVKPTQLDSIDRASPYLRTPAPAQDMLCKLSTVQNFYEN
jgi:hypothetical protein